MDIIKRKKKKEKTRKKKTNRAYNTNTQERVRSQGRRQGTGVKKKYPLPHWHCRENVDGIDRHCNADIEKGCLAQRN